MKKIGFNTRITFNLYFIHSIAYNGEMILA
jgi:hypothetical protein